MKFIQVKDYKHLSREAADLIINRVRQTPSLKLGLATGETPIETYRLLIDDHQKNGTSYKQVKTFNLDEYVGLSGEHEQSYHYFMKKYLFDHIDIPKECTYIPNGNGQGLAECNLYEDIISQHGGIDLQLLGIGRNGHIGFNEPGTSFDSKTHVIDLTPSTREANARFFNGIEKVPTKAITMGISTILQSKEILMIISGESKREALHNLIHNGIDEAFPASALKNHPNVTVIVDEAACGNTRLPN